MKQLNVAVLENTNHKQKTKYIKHVLSRGNSFFGINQSDITKPILNSISIGIISGILVSYGYDYYFPLYNFTIELGNLGSKNCPIPKSIPKSEYIKINFVKISLDDIDNISKKIVSNSFEDAKTIIKDPLDCSDKAKEEIVCLINRICLKYRYDPPRDIIYLISNIFKNILVEHYLINGNKRLASMILFNLLYISGLFLSLPTKTSREFFWKMNENKFIEFVEDYHKIATDEDFHLKDLRLLEKIYNWIYDNIQIVLNFIN